MIASATDRMVSVNDITNKWNKRSRPVEGGEQMEQGTRKYRQDKENGENVG